MTADTPARLTLDSLISVRHVSGVEGPSVYVNDHRIAGPKPWGGGNLVREWTTTAREILEALVGSPPAMSPADRDLPAADWHTENRRRSAPVLIERLAALESEPWTGSR